jgi:hypothetical protein
MSNHLTHSFRRAIIALATAIAVLVGASSASADSAIRLPGGSASFQSHGEKFRIWDLGCDGNAVYVRYQRGFESEREIRFNGGCHQMGLYDRNFAEHQSIRYKVCIDDFGPDTCSGYRRDHT